MGDSALSSLARLVSLSFDLSALQREAQEAGIATMRRPVAVDAPRRRTSRLRDNSHSDAPNRDQIRVSLLVRPNRACLCRRAHGRFEFDNAVVGAGKPNAPNRKFGLHE